ncbi:uncharacterized protein LOC110991166 [Acanthaster planci]|uniref:Uncharacterized protein LOC110991166 n=1 Tax=Acanthaster planci TaxID=133434 RepID=A0A8B8A587_ACAPL|nr:uncharacterized protein LOC110991166 [Acanthaster planci]XP_022112076.1 uncharacterized protein LOC110991166 [Acanthaster planci]
MDNDIYRHHLIPTQTNSSHDGLEFHRRLRLTSTSTNDVGIVFVFIMSLAAVTSGAFVIYGLWQSKRQHRRLREALTMDSKDFLFYTQIAQHEISSAPCITSLPCQIPYIEGDRPTTGSSSHPPIAPGYIRIVQVTHPAAEELNERQPLKSVVARETENKAATIPQAQVQSLPKTTSSAPAILSGLWKQRHLLTGNKDALVDSFTTLKKPIRPQRVRASISDTSPMIDRPDNQLRRSICEECGSGSFLLVGSLPRNISCRLCRQRAGIRDVGGSTKDRIPQERNSLTVTKTTPHIPTTERDMALTPIAASPKLPSRPKLSTFSDNRRKSCTPEVQAQLDPFRTMVLMSSSSEDLTSDSDW